MSRAQFALVILVAFLGGLVGGWATTKYVVGNVAFAEGEGISFKRDRIYAGKVIAEEFFLEEKKDRDDLNAELSIPRAVLTTQKNGQPQLIMQDGEGKPRLSIGLDDDSGPTLVIFNADGKPKALFAEHYPKGQIGAGPALAMMDRDGQVRAQIGVREDGNPFLSLVDPPSKENQSVRGIKLSLEEKERARLSVTGGKRDQGAELLIDGGNTRLALKDADGVTRAELGSTELAFGKDGSLEKVRGGSFSVEKRPESSLVLYDEKGKVLWSAP